MIKKKIPEIRYRASRICRALGNPSAYEMLNILEKGERTPEEIASMLGLSMATVSQTLRILRDLDLVRYEVEWRKRVYWIKTDGIMNIMSSLEQLIRTIEKQE